MNFVVIMTDTQLRDMVGAYGHPAVDTPNLDRLAAEGLRFDRAYTACPLCTPARSAIFSGTHPTVNGAWCNNVPPYPNTPLLGTIFRHHGYRVGYTGKWHLDGSGYFGDGEPGGGFEPDWWYDGKRYAEELGPAAFQTYRTARTPAELRAAGFDESRIWGHRVADRAIAFLRQVRGQPFVLAVSFDEPHGPFVAPPEYWESFPVEAIPRRPAFGRGSDSQPRLQQLQHAHTRLTPTDWPAYQARLRRFFACNAYIDREIGRVLAATAELAGDDTTILYTSDHGDMLGAHGLTGKGAVMYEEATNIPFLVKTPGGPRGVATPALASQVDIIPTMLDLAGLPRPPSLHGVSLQPVLADPAASARPHALISFTRFAINHDDWGEFYPIRCLTDGRYKLAINLLDTDELYDLATDPGEETNLIADARHAAARDRLHDALLDELDRIRDPFRSYLWGARPWRTVRQAFYHGGQRRPAPLGFPFQPVGIESDGVIPGQRPG
jgi:uncharacterized sulfatase